MGATIDPKVKAAIRAEALRELASSVIDDAGFISPPGEPITTGHIVRAIRQRAATEESRAAYVEQNQRRSAKGGE